ncbi:hypothetical protein ACHQM5_014835 [Ranunculus cassubicifolius]
MKQVACNTTWSWMLYWLHLTSISTQPFLLRMDIHRAYRMWQMSIFQLLLRYYNHQGLPQIHQRPSFDMPRPEQASYIMAKVFHQNHTKTTIGSNWVRISGFIPETNASVCSSNNLSNSSRNNMAGGILLLQINISLTLNSPKSEFHNRK